MRALFHLNSNAKNYFWNTLDNTIIKNVQNLKNDSIEIIEVI